MVSHRMNKQALPPAENAGACFAAMQRHHRNGTADSTRHVGAIPPLAAVGQGGGNGDGGPKRPAASPGDVIYGARAIARFLFDDDGNTARRRVFNLWAHYRDREEAAGFFKLKGALCLSKTQWLAFHGLG